MEKTEPAHVVCNRNNRQTFFTFLPITFHNLSSYDAPIFFTESSKGKKKKNKLDFIDTTD